MTAPVAVVNFMNYVGWEWGRIAAGGVMVMLPVLVIFPGGAAVPDQRTDGGGGEGVGAYCGNPTILSGASCGGCGKWMPRCPDQLRSGFGTYGPGSWPTSRPSRAHPCSRSIPHSRSISAPVSRSRTVPIRRVVCHVPRFRRIGRKVEQLQPVARRVPDQLVPLVHQHARRTIVVQAIAIQRCVPVQMDRLAFDGARHRHASQTAQRRHDIGEPDQPIIRGSRRQPRIPGRADQDERNARRTLVVDAFRIQRRNHRACRRGRQ